MSEQEKYYARKNNEYKADKKAQKKAAKEQKARDFENSTWAQSMYD